MKPEHHSRWTDREGVRAVLRLLVARRTWYVAGLAGTIAAWLLPLYVRDSYVLDVLSITGLFVLLAIGLNVVVSLAGLLDLGYIAFWAVGAYTAALLSSSMFQTSVPFVLIIPVAVVATSLFAVAIGFPTLRLRGGYLAMVTLGFGEIVRITLINADQITGGPAGISGIARPSAFGHQFTHELGPYYILIYGFCLAGVLIARWLRDSEVGLIWRALRDDELAAMTCGVRPLTYYLSAFAIGAAFAGVSGALFAAKQTAISPESFTVDNSILVLAIVILGGLSGRILPVILAALVVVAAPEALRGFKDYRLVLFGPLLVTVVIARDRWPDLVVRARSLTELLGQRLVQRRRGDDRSL